MLFCQMAKKLLGKIGLSRFISDFCRHVSTDFNLMRRLFLLLALSLGAALAQARNEGGREYCVAFYNLENLFDTVHDVGKNDLEFLPTGSYRWTAQKYEAKLRNMAKVLSSLGRERVEQGPAFIGVAEVENARVLTDLLAQPALRGQYESVHYEGPDKRGIDCALLFDPKQFEVETSQLVLSRPYEGDTLHPTRGFLIVTGRMAGRRVAVVVNHWPSRGAGSPVRVHAARQVRALTDSLMRADRRLRLVVMGDLNDDPMDESLQVLGACKYEEEVCGGKFYNPWWAVLEDEGRGTLLYRGKWNLFDQIVLSKGWLRKRRGLRYAGCQIFAPDYLFQHEGKYAGSPLRTHGGRTWLNGYSDHLPTVVYLKR